MPIEKQPQPQTNRLRPRVSSNDSPPVAHHALTYTKACLEPSDRLGMAVDTSFQMTIAGTRTRIPFIQSRTDKYNKLQNKVFALVIFYSIARFYYLFIYLFMVFD